MKSVAAPAEYQTIDQRLRMERIASLYRGVTLGVTTAAFSSLLFAGILYHLQILRLPEGPLWALFICLCGFAHILLRYFYTRRKVDGWHGWAIWFTCMCMAEGIGWGWASVGLTRGLAPHLQLLALTITLGVCSGAIPVFGVYAPAFLAFLLPATLPYVFVKIAGPTEFDQITVLLLIVFIVAMVVLAQIFRRNFAQSVRLRIQTEDMAAELRRQKDIAEEASRAKSSFLAAASHDLRQPVHALSLFAGALRRVPMPEEGLRLVERIETSTSDLDGLFAGLLDISRFDAGVVEVKIVNFELAPLIERICRDHSEEARAKGLVLRSVRSSAVTRSDPLLVERVIRNFITNAIRYTDRGGIVVGVRRRGIDHVVQVWDTGPGIAEQDQTRIFDEFVQIGNTERDRAKGLGLGLAIVRRLSTLLSAPLDLRSWPGRGSCFEIRLPAAEAAAIPHVEREESIVAGALARGLIVVIDDEEPIREAMESLLSGWGHEVIGAASGDEAIAKLALCPTRPSLIISDYRLRQQENGIDVVERLRGEYNEQIAALLVTGDTAPERLRDAAQSGLTLIHKPVRNNRLRAAITNAMRGYTGVPTEEDQIKPA